MSDFSTMDDAALEASLMDAEAVAPPAEEAVPSPAGDEPVTPEEPEVPADEAKPDDWNPEGPGDLKVALKKKQEEARQAKAEAEAYRAQVEEFQRQQAQAAEAARHREAQAEYNRLLEEEGEEAATAFAARYEAGEYKTALERVEQEKVQIRIQATAEAFIEAHQDYVPRVQRLYEVLGQDFVDRMAFEQAKQGQNPAKWAYEFAKSHFPTPEDRQAEIQAAVKAALKEAQSKTNPPATRGHETIGHISSGTQAPVAKKPVRKMTQAELERSLREG